MYKELLQLWSFMIAKYRISSYKTRGYYFLQGLQLRVLLERGYYSRAGFIIKIS